MTTSDFSRDGFLGPVRLFSPKECRRIAAYLRRNGRPAPAGWKKGRAVHERFLYELAIRPAVIDRVAALVGEEVVLWGVSPVVRQPRETHAWHSDIESCDPGGGFVSVWIGIANTTRDSSLQIITRSHLLGKSVQEARAAAGIPRSGATPETLLKIARESEPDADLVLPDMGNGDAIFFDGRLWHGSDNRNRVGTRVALILQFAAADRPVRIPDLSQRDWPFRLREEPLPPVILMRGTDRGGPNRTVQPPPPTGDAPMVETAIHTFDFPLGDGEQERPWQPLPAFRGPTRTASDMKCHASVLVGGHTPHPPHAHVEEELLMPLHGEVELTIPSGKNDPSPRSALIRPGSFVFYPAWQYHTIRNPGSSPVAYLMFKWQAPVRDDASPLGVQVVDYDAPPPADARGFWTHHVLNGTTGCLGKLHAHLTQLAPGAGYEAHRDSHDVAIVVLDGTVETLGRKVGANSVVYIGAGEMHGMRNPGDVPARYLVFEFHAPGTVKLEPLPATTRLKAFAIRTAKRLLRPVWRRVKPMLGR